MQEGVVRGEILNEEMLATDNGRWQSGKEISRWESDVCERVQVTVIDVEYIYGFVGWGVCKQSRWRHSVTVP